MPPSKKVNSPRMVRGRSKVQRSEDRLSAGFQAIEEQLIAMQKEIRETFHHVRVRMDLLEAQMNYLRHALADGSEEDPSNPDTPRH